MGDRGGVDARVLASFDSVSGAEEQTRLPLDDPSAVVIALNATLDEQRAELGELLGLDAPVSREVLLASLRDATYAHNLLTCRGVPALLEPLLARPPAPPAHAPSEVEVLRTFAESMLRWGRSAFAYADDVTYRARLDACGACEHRQAAGETLLHKLANFVVSNTAVCGLCQCLVDKKARAAPERCPGPDPARPGFNRWGQEIAP